MASTSPGTLSGGRWTGEKIPAIGSGFPYLFDGMAVENHGLQLRGGTQRHEVDVIVELAGGEPIEVAGIALSELSGADAPQFLRNLDFALSMDGETFTPAVEGELTAYQGGAVLCPRSTHTGTVRAAPSEARLRRHRRTRSGPWRAQGDRQAGIRYLGRQGIQHRRPSHWRSCRLVSAGDHSIQLGRGHAAGRREVLHPAPQNW